MTLEQIKEEARNFSFTTTEQLEEKVLELKNKNIPFWGCVAFVQTLKKVSLRQALDYTLEMKVWSNEKNRIIASLQLAQDEYDEQE